MSGRAKDGFQTEVIARRERVLVRPVSQVVLELPGGDANFRQAQSCILKWMEPRARVPLPKEAWEGRTFSLDLLGAQTADAVAIENPRYWAARLKDADKTVPQREWTTEIGLAVETASRTVLGVRLSMSGSSNEAEWNRSIPGLVRQVVQSLPVTMDAIHVTDSLPVVATSDDVADLVSLITSNRRRRDVIVISLAEGVTDWREAACNADAIHNKTLGVAHVRVITGPASYQLTESLGKEWSVFHQAVRTYRPNFKSDHDELFQHPLTLPARISGWSGGASAYEAFLVNQSLARSVTHSDSTHEVPSFYYVRQIAAQLATNTAKEAGDSPNDLIGLYEAEVVSLRDQIAKQRELNDGLLLDAQQEIDGLKEEVEELQSRSRMQSARIAHLSNSIRNTPTTSPAVPTTLDNIRKWCEENLAGSVTMNPRAYRGLKDSEYEDVALIYKALLLLRDRYVAMKRSGSEEERQKFDEECRHLGVTEENTGSPERAGEEGEEYFIKFSGKRRFLERHLKKGNSREKRHCFRLYFFWDDESEQAVVGWLPSHLTSRVT